MADTRLICCLAAAFSSLPLTAHAQNATPIGVVLAVKGVVEAQARDGSRRSLQRRSALFEGDTVQVGANGSAQLKLIDDARLVLKADTEFTFDSYVFDGDDATPDEAVMSMVRGAFRTISGSIGEQDHDEYRLDTPMASMGIRGTVHEGVIVGDVLFTGVYEGGTTVSNNFGSLDTGIGADFDFAETRLGQPPAGLLLPPPVFGQLGYLAALVVDETSEADQESGAAASPGQTAGTDTTGTGPTGPAPVAAVRNANGDDPGAALNQVALAAVTGRDIEIRSASEPTTSPALDTEPELNPVLNIRSASALALADTRGGGQSGNSNAGGGNPNAGGGNPNSGGGNPNAGGGNPNSGGGNPNAGGGTPNTGGGNPNAGGGNPNSGGGNPNAGGGNPNSGGGNPNAGGGTPNTGGGNPNAGGGNPNTGGGNPNAGGGNPNSGGGNPNAGGGNPNTGGGNPNAGGGNPNSGGGNPNAGGGNPNAASNASVSGQQLALRQDAGMLAPESLLGWSALRQVDIAALHGSFSYQAVARAQGVDQSGAALQAVGMSFDVNLAGGNGAVSNGALRVLDGASDPWQASFAGSVVGGALLLQELGGTLLHAGGSQPVSGDISGMFAGSTQAPAFVGSFVLQSGERHVSGQVQLHHNLPDPQ